MQRDTVIIKPKVNLAISLVMLPMLIVFFRPSFWEIVGFFAVDVISYMVLMPFDIPLFQRYFPLSRVFFPGIKPELYDVDGFDGRAALYHAMAKFPLQRSLYILALSFIKVTPAFAYGLWIWGDRYSALEILFKGFVVCAFTFSYGVGVAFLGYHNQMSSTLEAVHQKSNWSDVFKAVNPLPDKALFHRFEVVAILGVLVFWLGMICMIPFEQPISPWLALLQILYLSAFGFYFMAQIYGASWRQIMQGLESLIAFHSEAGKNLDPRGLPLSTNPTLAFYQKTVNDMIERNIASEQEIHRWILRKAEDTRYLQLGRVTGLFIHDLATPLTIMGLSLSKLEDQGSNKAVTQRYVERLRFCLQQITDFIGNLRLSIRDSAVNARQASPYLAHQAALRMLSYLHERQTYNKLKFECQVDPELRVSFPQPELNQVILNLYSNAVTNLLQNKVENPCLAMRIALAGADRSDLIVHDNGTGLSLKNFEFITEEAERLPGKEGIGLKLTKRLVELYGGSLNLVESSEGQGSAFVINLPLVNAGTPANPALPSEDGSTNVRVDPDTQVAAPPEAPQEISRKA
jgi:signal transduction histidine kinase